MSQTPVVAILDDDEAVREALFDLLQVEGLAARTFDGAPAFLADKSAEGFDCLITDVRMPEMDGLELQRQLRTGGSLVPVIFLTSLRDEALRTRAMLEGATAWLTKPVGDETLLRAVRSALARPDAAQRAGIEPEPPGG